MENATKVCPYCGQVLGAEETFCTKCGQMYTTSSNDANAQQQAYTTNNNANAQQQAYTTNNNANAQQQVYTTNNNANAQQQVYTTGNNVADQAAYVTDSSYTTTAPYAEPAPETSTEVPAEEKPKKKKTGLIIGIVAGVIVIVALVVAGIFVGPKLFNKDSKATNNEKTAESGDTTTIVTEDGQTIQLDNDTYLLEMYPDTKCSKDDLKEIAGVIEKRVKVLGDDFKVTSDDEKVSLTIDQNLLGSTPEERAHNLRLIESNGGNAVMLSGIYTSCWGFEYDNIESLEIETVDKDEFVEENKSYFSEPTKEALKGVSGDINVIRAKVDSGMVEAIERATNILDDETLVIATDILDETVEEMLSERKIIDIIPIDEDDYEEFYIVSPQAQSKKNAELVIQLLENKGFDYNLETRLIAEPEWETDSVVMGENQKKDISGDAVTFEYTPSAYTLSHMEGDEYDEYIEEVKEKLDALNTPYALGYAGIKQETIVVKISPEKMSEEFGRVIFGSSENAIYTQFKSLTSSIGSIEILEDYEGAPAIKVELYSSKAELYATYSLSQEESFDVILSDEETTEYVDDGQPKPIYLVLSDVNVASADLSEMSDEDNTIIFKNFLFAGDKGITSDDMDVLNMFKVAKDKYTYLATSTDDEFEIVIRHYDGKKEITDDIKWGYDSKNEYDEDMVEKVEKLGHEMTFSPGKRNTAVIEIDVKIDDDLAENFCEEVKTVYNECGFGEGAYAGVIFKVKNETKKSASDRCRLVFSKDSYDKVDLTYMDYVSGPTFSEYWSDFYNLLDEDEFFAEKARY